MERKATNRHVFLRVVNGGRYLLDIYYLDTYIKNAWEMNY